MERTWKRRPFSTETYPEHYYTVYYSKLDSNGNILINEMILDADEKRAIKLTELLIGIFELGVIIVCRWGIIIALIFIVIIVIIRRRKRRKKSSSAIAKSVLIAENFSKFELR